MKTLTKAYVLVYLSSDMLYFFRGEIMHKLITTLINDYKIDFSDFEEFKSDNFYDALNNAEIAILDKDTQFITRDEPVNKVWILLDGEVRAVQEYASGDILSFRTFKAKEVFGKWKLLVTLKSIEPRL